MNYEMTFGILAAVGWLLSSYYWYQSTTPKTPFIKGDEIAAAPINAYFEAVGRLNRIAGILSALSAFLSAASIVCGAFNV